jgi:hypothetical protein
MQSVLPRAVSRDSSVDPLELGASLLYSFAPFLPMREKAHSTASWALLT